MMRDGDNRDRRLIGQKNDAVRKPDQPIAPGSRIERLARVRVVNDVYKGIIDDFGELIAKLDTNTVVMVNGMSQFGACRRMKSKGSVHRCRSLSSFMTS